MTVNKTLSIDDELAKKMDEMKEINWSQVAREAFASYIATREDPEISDIIKELADQRSKQYAKGLSTALDHAKHNTYENIAGLLESYDYRLSIHNQFDRTKEENTLSALGSVLRDYGIGPGHKTQEFLRGFLAGLIKIKKGLGD